MESDKIAFKKLDKDELRLLEVMIAHQISRRLNGL